MLEENTSKKPNQKIKVATEVKTEAEYSAQLIKLLITIIKWLIIAIFSIIVIFLAMVIFILVSDNVEIEIGHKQNTTIVCMDNSKTFDV